MPKEFESDFGDKDMPSDMQERTPGVYVRAENSELPHELDMLWSNNRSYHREERSPLISFIAGLLVGSLLTAAVFFLFIMRPQIKAGENEITAPVTEDVGTGATPSNSTAARNSSEGSSRRQNSGTTSANGTTYTVVSGDNLGKIAGKVYGSSHPQYIEKIQRANNISSPDSLQINQTLVIPPKDY